MEEESQEKKKMTPEELQALVFQLLASGVMIIAAVMIFWIFLDLYNTITRLEIPPNTLWIAEPIIWHKLGLMLVAFPIGIGLIGYLFYFSAETRARYFKIALPIMIAGGIINLIAVWGLLSRPFTELTDVYIALSLVMAFFSVAGLFVLRWISTQIGRLENEFGYKITYTASSSKS